MGLNRETLETSIKQTKNRIVEEQRNLHTIQVKIDNILAEGNAKLAPLTLRRNDIISELTRLQARGDKVPAEDAQAVKADIEAEAARLKQEIRDMTGDYQARQAREAGKRTEAQKRIAELEADLRLDERLLARVAPPKDEPAAATPTRSG